jgi:CheY-like chemotaxis protein
LQAIGILFMADILLIDDDDMVRATTRAMLEIGGHQVREADSGFSGIDQFRDVLPDMVITDIVMPDMDGLETIQALFEINGNVRILAISGGGRMLDSTTYLSVATRFGAKTVLKKPFLSAELLETVSDILQTE